MYMKKIVLVLFMLFCVQGLFAQEYLSGHQNQVDDQGRRQGEWKVYDQAGNLKFVGQFKDDIPFGEFTYYYPSGKVKAVSMIFDSGRSSYTKTYHENGFLMAEGKYVNREKDSVWKYYSKYDKNLLLSEETYVDNEKEGIWYNYYPDGSVAEEISYKDDQKHGPWKQYFDDGSIKIRAKYEEGELEGLFQAFYPNGQASIAGTYEDAMKNGVWMYFDEDGQTIQREEYDHGYLIDREVLQEDKLVIPEGE